MSAGESSGAPGHGVGHSRAVATWREIHSDRTIDRLLRSCWVPRDLCLKFAASVPFQPNLDWIRDDQPQGFAETLHLRKHLTVTAATLLRRRRGPNPAVTTAAKEKLRHMLRTGEILQAISARKFN